MKLIRLKLNSPFRSLHAGFETHFLRDFDFGKKEAFNPYCLVGKNGSGKSNVLEALAAIFYHIECVYLDYKPESFEKDEEHPDGFDETLAVPDAFELEYFINVKQEGMQRISITKQSKEAPILKKADELLDRVEVKTVLPEYVVGYSSGSNEVLSLPFYKMRFVHFDEYRDRLLRKLDFVSSEGRLVYLDANYSQAIVLSNFLFQKDAVLEPFRTSVGVDGVKSFRLIIREHSIHSEYTEEGYSEAGYEESEPVALTGLLRSESEKAPGIIDRLIKCSTMHHYDKTSGELILDYWIGDATYMAFNYHFGEARKLFEAFQILLTLNYYHVDEETKQAFYHSDSLYVNETIPTTSAKERIFRFSKFLVKKEGLDAPVLLKSLSDGEHQYLHTVGLALLYRGTSSLFLLDEPETHFNPKWRAEFISTLRDCLDGEGIENKPEILITSHSPFIVSDTYKEQVLVFEKENGRVNYRHPDFNTFGASVNKITMSLFDQGDTIGGYAQQKLNELREKFAVEKDEAAIIREADALLGDSVEKMLFVNSLIESKER